MTTMGSAMTSERLKEQLVSAFQNNLPQNDYAKNSASKSTDPDNVADSNMNQNNVRSIYLPQDVTCELMVHPGFVNVCEDGGCGSGPDAFSKSPDREHEMDLLMSEDMITFYDKEGYKLCSYYDLS
jgi:predicted glycoside hydrolase/deacetylase ChbG (UPF0249 family)